MDLARRGQGRFRERVARIEHACRITGVNRPEHLIVSHCKPLHDCASNDVRLNGESGLLLTPTVDHVRNWRGAGIAGGASGVAEADGDRSRRKGERGGVFGRAEAVPRVSPGGGIFGGEGEAVNAVRVPIQQESGCFSRTSKAVTAGQCLSMASPTHSSDPAGIARRILVLRGQRVLLDADLAKLCGVSTSRLNQQVRRTMTNQELANLMLQSATSSWGGTRKPPVAFTEHGAIMVATVLNSPRAVEMSVYVVRAFVKLRQVLASNTELASKLETLEKSVSTLDARTRRQFEEDYEAIRALMAPPAVKSRPIGFTADGDKDA